MEPANDPFLKTVQHLSSAAQWDRLLRIALERLEQMPADDTAHRSAALALIRLRRGNKARLHVDYLLRDDPEHAFHHELAAQVAVGEGKFLKAQEHLAVGIRLDPEKVALHRLMISVQCMLGRPKEAQRYAQRVFELEGDCLRSWLMQEAAWEAEGQSPHTLRERIQALDQALKQDPEHSYLLWRVGRLLLKLEYPTAAQVWLARALTGDSSNPTYAADWRNSCERKFLVYRALVFPWAAWRWVSLVLKTARLRPDLWPSVFILSMGWLLLLPWWLLSWVCLAPLGLVVRYFMFLHPAFDFHWVPRLWLQRLSWNVRAGLMGGGGVLLLVGLGWACSWEYTLSWLGVTLGQWGVQCYLTDVAIQEKRSVRPPVPPAWLSSE